MHSSHIKVQQSKKSRRPPNLSLTFQGKVCMFGMSMSFGCYRLAIQCSEGYLVIFNLILHVFKDFLSGNHRVKGFIAMQT